MVVTQRKSPSISLAIFNLFFHQLAKVLRSMALFVFGDFGRGAFGNYPTALLATLGTEVDDVVGNLDNIEIVLDYDNGISLVYQLVKHLDKATNILEMESRSRLVENVERATRLTLRKLRREFNSLTLAG